ncbi:MAG: BrnA antitoxin family protein [Pseudomonadota bacterium]
MTDRKLKLSERLALLELNVELKQQQVEMETLQRQRDLIPSAWHEMEEIAPCTPPKQKLSLVLDRDVVKFYRALGRGYQARMNAILRTWMQARRAKVITGHGDTDWYGDPI